ncbi:MAG TPA: amidase [Acidimicrobiales bacterium]|nr:amidase [Acidimicrobiales bacterium]
MSRELWSLSALTLAEMVREGDASAREIADAHLARIDEVNGAVNAIVEVRPDEVRAAADAADAARRSGDDLGPLHGVPFTVKINLDQDGYATNEGVAALADRRASSDAPVVQRMREAGAVALARTNMPDLGLRLNTESELYGATHNPWRRGLTVGGSSGGAAAALATGMGALALGNDIGGSLRNPAYACGVTSIKPSRGRVPTGNATAPSAPPVNSQLMHAEGVLARHVADVRAGLVAVMGSHPFDPDALDAPLEGPAVPRRVALVPEPIGGSTDPVIADAVRRAGATLESAGYAVEEVEPPQVFDAYLAWSMLMVADFEVEGELLASQLGADGRRFLELSTVDFGESTVASVHRIFQDRHAAARAWRGFMEEFPLIVGPTWTQRPFAHGFDIVDAESAFAVVEMVRFVTPANALGLPAVSVPTGVVDGLPTGVQVIGRGFREDTCLDAAEAIERALGVLTPIDPRE